MSITTLPVETFEIDPKVFSDAYTNAVATGNDRKKTTDDRRQTGEDLLEVEAARDAALISENNAAAAAAQASAAAAEAARDAAFVNGDVYADTAAGIGQGIAGVTSIVAGSGGTDGTFALAFSGGTQVLAPVGVFTVIGGALVSVLITYPGYYSAGTPTLSFAASAGLTGASAVAQMAANTPVNGFFAVPSTVLGEAAIVYRNIAGVATEQFRTQSSVINGYESDPFPADAFETSQLFRMVDLVAPSNLLVSAGNLVTVPNTGVYYAKLPLTSSGYAVGDTVRVAIKKVSGATMPTTFRFLNAANAAITTLSFVLVNGWYICEGTIPALTVSLNIYYTNSGGDTSVFYQPKIARAIARTSQEVADRRNMAGLIADAGEPKNYWSPVVLQVPLSGIGNAVINSDGTVTIPDGLTVELRPNPSKFVLPTTGVITVLVRLSSANVGSVKIKTYGAVSGVSTFEMLNIGDGYWRWTGQPLVAGQTQINNVCPIIDNRTPATAGYTAAPITLLGDCLVVTGAVVPDHKLPLGATVSDRIVAYAGIPAAIADKTAKVAPAGGDFTTLPLALASAADAASNRRYALSVAPGIYQSAEWHDVDFVDVIGAGIGNTIIDFQQPDGTVSADVIAYSAINMTNTSRLEGMTVRTRNGRYGIHLDGFKKFPNRMQEIINCQIEHMGNVNPYWSAENGIGAGMSSGQTIRLRGSTILAKNGAALSYHTNADFTAPTLIDVEDCTLVAHASNIAMIIIPSGSDMADKCRIVGTVLGGDIKYQPQTWFPTVLAKQPANHSEIAVFGHGNSPSVFRNEDFGEALQIVSANTGSGSSVVIGGDAVAKIFGDGTTAKYDSRMGTSGFAGRVSGWGDVSGVAVGSPATYLITSLGTRLGDCSSVNKTLTVAVDGGAALTVTFNQDFTAQTNTQVLTFINGVLGAAALASTWKPGTFYRPSFADEEQSLKNNTATGIPFGTVLAFDTRREYVRPMTSTDAASLFAGVAWQDIDAGKRGRIKTRGWLPLTDLRRVDSAAVAFGNTFSVDASNPGMITLGGSQGLLSAIRTNAVMVA